jgi:hypothetical protein
MFRFNSQPGRLYKKGGLIRKYTKLLPKTALGKSDPGEAAIALFVGFGCQVSGFGCQEVEVLNPDT